MKFSSIVLLSAFFLAGSAKADELSCQSERRFGGEGALQVRAGLHRSGKSITGFTMESVTLVYATKTGYSCSEAFDLATPHATWHTSGAMTTISVESDEAGEKSVVSIRRTAKGYWIDPQGLSRSTCGARGQWPASVFVPLNGGRCTTRY